MTSKLFANSKNGLHWYSGSNIAAPHGMFTRHGGTSSDEYTSLNLSFGVGDDRRAIQGNRNLVKQALNIRHLISSRQVHGDAVALIETVDGDWELEGYDALITSQPEVGLLIQQADCQAVLLHDPNRRVIAAIHNGWRGSVADIIGKTIRSMQKNYSVAPRDLMAVISPSLGPCCGEFVNYRQELPPEFYPFQKADNRFDFRAISCRQLRHAGVPESHIETCGICTVCSRDFFSYRRARKQGTGVTRRNGSVIALVAYPTEPGISKSQTRGE